MESEAWIWVWMEVCVSYGSGLEVSWPDIGVYLNGVRSRL